MYKTVKPARRISAMSSGSFAIFTVTHVKMDSLTPVRFCHLRSARAHSRAHATSPMKLSHTKRKLVIPSLTYSSSS